MKIDFNGEDRTMNVIEPCEVEIVNIGLQGSSAKDDKGVAASMTAKSNIVSSKRIDAQTAPSFHTEAAVRNDIPVVTEFVEAQLEKFNFSEENAILIINIAIDEIYSNIVRHGYTEQPGPVTVSVYEGTEPHAVFIRFEDEGIPYDPLAKPDPDITLSIEKRAYGGMGILIVKKMMDDMKYEYENGKNILTVAKYF